MSYKSRAKKRAYRQIDPAPPFPCPKCGQASALACRDERGRKREPHPERFAHMREAKGSKGGHKRRRGARPEKFHG